MIDEAALGLYSGYVAPGLIGMVEASNSPAPKVAVYEVAVTETLMWEGDDHANGHEEDAHGHKEEEHADEHGHEGEEHSEEKEALVADPHIWHNGAIATVIAAQLANVNPDQSDFYQTNATALAAQFAELDVWIQTQIETIPVSDRKLVTTHNAFVTLLMPMELR